MSLVEPQIRISNVQKKCSLEKIVVDTLSLVIINVAKIKHVVMLNSNKTKFIFYGVLSFLYCISGQTTLQYCSTTLLIANAKHAYFKA